MRDEKKKALNAYLIHGAVAMSITLLQTGVVVYALFVWMDIPMLLAFAGNATLMVADIKVLGDTMGRKYDELNIDALT